MKKILASVIVLVGISYADVAAQCDSRVEFSPDGRRAIGVFGLMSPTSTRGYGRRQIVGTIAQVSYDEETGAAIVGFAITLNNGIRQYVDITHDYEECVLMMANADRGWLPYIIRRGNRVRVDAYISGSGGFINAHNIIVLNSGNRARRSRRR